MLHRKRDTLRKKRHFAEKETLYGERDTLQTKRHFKEKETLYGKREKPSLFKCLYGPMLSGDNFFCQQNLCNFKGL